MAMALTDIWESGEGKKEHTGRDPHLSCRSGVRSLTPRLP